MHPATLFLALKDAGMSCRVRDGKLLINPVASLAGELREQVITHRADLIAWLEAAEDDDARADALALEAALVNPFDDAPAGAVLIERQSVLIKVSLPGEPPCYAAVDPDWWGMMRDWLRGAKANPKKKPRKKSARRKGA